MKKLITLLTIAFIAAFPLRAMAQNNIENDPAYLGIDKAFDFKTIKAAVNINLPKFLLKDALAELDGGKNDPFAGSNIKISELLQDIKLIRVVVIEGDKANSEAVAKGIATIRSTLEKKWTPIAVVAEKNENVGVYAISDASGEGIGGLAVMIHEGRGQAVVANIVGRVSLGKIIKVASQMNKLPKDLLKKLSTAAENAEKPKDDSGKSKN